MYGIRIVGCRRWHWRINWSKKAGNWAASIMFAAYYLQDWAGPDVPLIWRFSKEIAGSGSHGDLGAHIIDMARFITGDEIVEVTGAIAETFIKERTLPSARVPAAGSPAARSREARWEK